MLFDTAKVLKTLDGDPIKDGMSIAQIEAFLKQEISAGRAAGAGAALLASMKEHKPITLGGVAINALLAQFEDERNLSGEDKVARFDLANRLHDQTLPVQIKSEEAALIKKLVAKLYNTLVVGQTWQAIESPPASMVNGKVSKAEKSALA